MGEWLSNLGQQLGALPPARQAMLAITAAGSLAFFGWLAVSAGAPEYRALYRGLPEDQTARVADALAAEKIDYRLGDGGTSILVPAGEVYEARIRVAGRGLPSGSAAGLELFDRPAFGVTDFVHRVNYMRAVQGELSRSIEQLEPVERARVQESTWEAFRLMTFEQLSAEEVAERLNTTKGAVFVARCGSKR